MKKPTHKKHTLKKKQANAASNFFKRVFFSPLQKEIQIIFFATLQQTGLLLFANQQILADFFKKETAFQFYKN